MTQLDIKLLLFVINSDRSVMQQVFILCSCVSDGRDGVFACHQSHGGLAGVQLNHLCESKRDLLP